MTSAEHAYVFRHALLRDAAYELQLPADRARLHELAFHVIEQAFGGRAADPAPLEVTDPPPYQLHGTDSVAFELAEHARLGSTGGQRPELAAARAVYLRRAAEHAESLFQHEAAISAWESLAILSDGVARGEAMRRAGTTAQNSGRTDLAERAFEQALAIHRESGNRRLEGVALGALAGLYGETGRSEWAERTLEQALVIVREVGDRRSEGVSLGNLAVVYMQTQRMEKAERTLEQALAILREIGNRRFEGMALASVAIAYMHTGRTAEAEQALEQALDTLREIGDLRWQGIVLGNLAGLYSNTGRIGQAERAYDQALAILRDIGNRLFEGMALGNLALLYFHAGRVELADQTFGRALLIHSEVGNRRFEGMQSCDRALPLVALGRAADAREAWQAGAAILREIRATTELERKTSSMREACAKAGLQPFDEYPIPPQAAGGD